MPRNRISQTRAQHDEMMLALTLGSANRAPHCVIEPAQLALGAGIHVAHASHHGVRLIVEIQAVGNQFFQLDLRRHLKRSAAAGTSFASIPTRAPVVAASFTPVAWRTIPVRAVTGRPVATFTTATLALFTAATA